MINLMKKNPYLAAVLNFTLPGLGYIYLGSKRSTFAYPLFILSLVVGYVEWDEITTFLTGRGLTRDFTLYIVLYGLVFAYDAYMDALKK